MIDINDREYIWCEKFRPLTVNGCILPAHLKRIANGIVETKNFQNLLFYSGPGSGKALRHGENVITPDGNIPIEEIQIGDLVAGTTDFVKVMGVFHQGIRDCYRVSFTDGTHLDVDGDHLWTLEYKQRGKRTLTTISLKEKYLEGKEKKKIYSLPVYNPLRLEEKHFSISPYILGVWLGDGSSVENRINCPKGKINETKIGEFYYKTIDDRCGYYVIKGLYNLLNNKLFGNKHIPEEYFYGSIQQRQDLLDGLLDTDGCNEDKKGITFDNINESLVEGVIRLARSLGYVVKRRKTREEPYYRDGEGNKVICNPCYRCVIKNPDARTAKRYVSNIEYVGKYDATCIMVDSEDHLFLAGDFIPTHNTTLARAICQELDLDYILINGSKEGRLIDTVRTTVTHFANTMSVLNYEKDKFKVVIYDEFDNAGEVQMAVRGLMDEVSSSCRFIFTGNYISKIIEPIHSRTALIDFSIPKDQQPEIMCQMMTRCCEILDYQSIKYKKAVLAQFIQKYFPDFRRVINELQSYSVVGIIDEGILDLTVSKYDILVDFILNKDFKGFTKWIDNNSFDGGIFSLLIKLKMDKMKTNSWLEGVLIANKFQLQHVTAIDPKLNLQAYCVEMMGYC